MPLQFSRRFLSVLFSAGLISSALAQNAATLTVDTTAPGKPISSDLVGIFYEDLSYAADGGLYAELVENRSFEYSAADRDGWHSLTSWELVERDGGRGKLLVDTGRPLHPDNPHYAVLGVVDDQGSVGLRNDGFDGIVIEAGKRYDLALFARQLAHTEGPLTLRLESASGELLGEAKLPTLSASWEQYNATIEATASADDARLLVLASHPGRIGLDMISLFPRDTFMNRENGLRPDLAQAIADLNPSFVRFPGGCLVHGDGLDNMYRWKDTVGPLEQRKAQRNIWHYHQSLGLGYFEYFQFCEDLGAEPIPVVPAGVTCQNSGASITRAWGQGQQAVPAEDMPAYIQEVLDLIEYANGPTDSRWGAVRAAAGHPEPFGLKYLGVGNEDKITPAFEERFRMIYDAVKARYPDITVIGTVGPSPNLDDADYRKGWALANELGLEMVDEHGYKSPDWFWDNLDRYDAYDRNQAQVYLGEYAAHDDGRRTTLRSALAEAAFLTSLERNGDIVRFASYAPLLAKMGNTHWNPDLIYFNNTEVFPTINYHVQKLFGNNTGETWLPTSISGDLSGRFAVSTVRDEASNDLIIKLVNGEAEPRSLSLIFEGLAEAETPASITVLSGDPMAENRPDAEPQVLPESRETTLAPAFDYTAPAHSLTIIRLDS